MIPISNKYAIDSDGEHNFIVKKKTIVKGEETYIAVAYHPKIEYSLEYIYNREAKQFIASQEGKTVKDVTEEWKQIQSSWLKNMIESAKEYARLMSTSATAESAH